MSKHVNKIVNSIILILFSHSLHAQDKTAWQLAEEEGLQTWAYYGCSFKTEEASGYISAKKIPKEKGIFVEGEGESLFLAMQDSLINIAFNTLNYTLAYSNGQYESIEEHITFPDFSSLTEMIDCCSNEKKYCVLLFLYDEKLKTIIENAYKSDFKVEVITKVSNNIAEKEIKYTYSSGD